MKPRRPLLLVLASAGALVLAVVIIVSLQRAQQRAVARAHLPARPTPDSIPPALGTELQHQERLVEGGGAPVPALARLASLYHGNGFYDEARLVYAGLRTLQPREPRWPHRLADVHANFGEVDAAIPLWEEALRLAPDYAPARIRLGESLLKAGRTPDARQVFEALRQRETRNPYALLGLARVELAQNHWAAARPLLEQAAAASDGLIGGDLLVTAYEQLGDTDRAEALRSRQKSHGLYVGPADPWLEEVMEDCYDSFRLALESGTASVRRDTARAQRLLDRALALDPDRAGLRFHAGTVADQQGDLRTARLHLETAVRLDAKLTDAWALLVRVVEKSGDSTAAWRLLNDGLAENPASPALLLERARRYRDQGRVSQAIADYRRVTRLRRDEALAFIELAGLLFRQEQDSEAIATLEQGLEAEPGHPAALAIITFASIQSGQKEAARKWLEEARHQPRLPAAELEQLRTAYQEKFGERVPSRANR